MVMWCVVVFGRGNGMDEGWGLVGGVNFFVMVMFECRSWWYKFEWFIWFYICLWFFLIVDLVYFLIVCWDFVWFFNYYSVIVYI